jgi:hypothetical protein
VSQERAALRAPKRVKTRAGHKFIRNYDRMTLPQRGHAAREAWFDMNLYTLIGSGLGTAEAASLALRLAAWHDAMVAHERRIRANRTDSGCNEDCAHSEARALWAEALNTFGDRAHELSFLRSRAMSPGSQFEDSPVRVRAKERTDTDNHRSSRSAARPRVSRRRPTSFLSTSDGRTTEAKRGAEL